MQGNRVVHDEYGLEFEEGEWLKPSQIKRVAQDLAASQDAKKLAFAAILGQTLDDGYRSIYKYGYGYANYYCQ